MLFAQLYVDYVTNYHVDFVSFVFNKTLVFGCVDEQVLILGEE